MPQNLSNIPTARLVDAVLDQNFRWMNEGRLGPTNALLDAEILQDNYPVLLNDALEELAERAKRMPISDCITEEKRRLGSESILNPILSSGKE